MTMEKQKILEMLEKGKITADEATRLLEVLGISEDEPVTASCSPKHNRKKLRVKVDGTIDSGEKIKVDVAVPLALGRMIDGILENCVPTDVQDELDNQGINITNLKIGEILDTMGDLDEDIVNVDIDNDDTKLKVRVHAE